MKHLTIVTPHDEAEDKILRLEDELIEAEQAKLAAAAASDDIESTVKFLVGEVTELRLDANAMASDMRKLREEVTWLRSGTSKVTTQLQASFVALGKEVQAMRYRDGGVPKPSASKN